MSQTPLKDAITALRVSGRLNRLPAKRKSHLTVKNPAMAAAAVMDAIFGTSFDTWDSGSLHVIPGNGKGRERKITRDEAEQRVLEVLERIELLERSCRK